MIEARSYRSFYVLLEVFMGFFSNLFGKQTCCICGSECGAMHRTKIKNKEYVCDECAHSCSLYVRLSEMDKDQVTSHMKFMENRNKVYEEVMLVRKGVVDYPTTMKIDQIALYDTCGMFAVLHSSNPRNKSYTEVIRYDEVDSIEPYEEKNPASEGKPETFKEAGVKIKIASTKGSPSKDSPNKNPHVHPYITHELKICLTKDESNKSVAVNLATYYYKHIFGTDDDRSRFWSMSKNEKANLKAEVDMANLIGSAIKAQKNGETDPEAIREQFEATQESVNRANYGRLADYSKLADEIFTQYPEQ